MILITIVRKTAKNWFQCICQVYISKDPSDCLVIKNVTKESKAT